MYSLDLYSTVRMWDVDIDRVGNKKKINNSYEKDSE